MAESIMAGGATQPLNGAIVGDNAPVAFGRQPLSQCCDMQTMPDGSVLVHAIEYWGAIGNAATTFQAAVGIPTQGLTEGAVVGTTHPWLASIANHYECSRLKALRYHYQHYAPTSVQGAVVMFWQPDALYNYAGGNGNLTAMIASQVLNSEYWVEGALYEDFCLDVPIDPQMPHGQWKYNFIDSTQTVIGDEPADPRLNYAGSGCVYIKNTAAASNFGDLFIETVYELKVRRSPSFGAGIDIDLTLIEKMQFEQGMKKLRHVMLRLEADVARVLHGKELLRIEQQKAEKAEEQEEIEELSWLEANSTLLTRPLEDKTHSAAPVPGPAPKFPIGPFRGQ
jgi:hypothetical protein